MTQREDDPAHSFLLSAVEALELFAALRPFHWLTVVAQDDLKRLAMFAAPESGAALRNEP